MLECYHVDSQLDLASLDPCIHWVPSISPSSLIFYTGDKFPRWKSGRTRGHVPTMSMRSNCIMESDCQYTPPNNSLLHWHQQWCRVCRRYILRPGTKLRSLHC